MEHVICFEYKERQDIMWKSKSNCMPSRFCPSYHLTVSQSWKGIKLITKRPKNEILRIVDGSLPESLCEIVEPMTA